MTEDEAKTKSCCGPPTVAIATLIASGLEMEGPTAKGECAGSACMAWRWDTDAWTLAFDDKGPLTRRKDYDEPQGYCGLAGRP
jgi:hypothetical protein